MTVEDFGVKTTQTPSNTVQEKLLHEIYTSSEKELQIYLEILNSIKKLLHL